MILGVDPGSRDGALVLLDGSDVHDWCAFWTRSSGFVAAWGHRPEPVPVDSLHDLGMQAARWMGVRRGELVVEDIIANRSRKAHPQSLVTLSQAVGALCGPLGLRWARRVPSEGWRRTVLGLGPRTPSQAAEEHAVRMAPQMFRWPGNGWSDADCLSKVARGALAEAACIGRWGVVAMTPTTTHPRTAARVRS